MYASFIKTDGKNYAFIAPSRRFAIPSENVIKWASRESLKSISFCEFLEDERDAMQFIADYAGPEGVEVEYIGF